MVNSNLEGFYKKNFNARQKEIIKKAGLSSKEAKMLKNSGSLDSGLLDKMIENTIGIFELPLGIANYFKINGKDYLIPMAIEESSVVAAASNGARMARETGGFKTKSSKPLMIGQIQLVNVKNAAKTKKLIQKNSGKLLKLANLQDKTLVKFGGGAKKIEIRNIGAKMLVVHLIVDVRDAMGANAINTMCEVLAPEIEKLTGEKTRLRIISNLAVHRLAEAKAKWKQKTLGKDVIKGIIEAYNFAKNDPFRATTHNKGIMNGVAALTIATGNDFRAIEAGAHAFASLKGKYKPLTKFYKDKKGDLIGEIVLPVQFGLVGGTTKIHPKAQLCLKILKVKNAQELGEVAAALGLAQNFAALRALASEGIQKGHMKLHAKNIAMMAGAKNKEIEKVSKKLVNSGQISFDMAKRILKELRGK